LFQLIIVPLFLSIVNILVTPVFGAGGGGGTKNETGTSALNFVSVGVNIGVKMLVNC
jgi:hypothetical protein